MLPAMVPCATLGRLAAEGAAPRDGLATGTRAVAFSLHKDQKLPDGAIPGATVDIVGEISAPIKTGIALLHVKLLAVDSIPFGVERPMTVTVQLTPAQQEVLALMQKHGTKLGIKLREKEKP
jgi:hypothetical protein